MIAPRKHDFVNALPFYILTRRHVIFSLENAKISWLRCAPLLPEKEHTRLIRDARDELAYLPELTRPPDIMHMTQN